MRRRDIDQLLRSKDKEITWLRGRVTELEDRLMVMADKPWTLPPAEMVETPKDEAENDEGWVSDPSQVIEDEGPTPLLGIDALDLQYGRGTLAR